MIKQILSFAEAECRQIGPLPSGRGGPDSVYNHIGTNEWFVDFLVRNKMISRNKIGILFMLILGINSCTIITKVELQGHLSGCQDVQALGIEIQGGGVTDYKINHLDSISFLVSFNILNTSMPDWIKIVSDKNVISAYSVHVKSIGKKLGYTLLDKNKNLVRDEILYAQPVIRISNLEFKCRQ